MGDSEQARELDGQHDGPVALDGGEAVDLRGSLAPVYKPSGPVHIYIGGLEVTPAILRRIVSGECVGIVSLLLGLWASQRVVPMTASFDDVVMWATIFVVPISASCCLLSRLVKDHVDARFALFTGPFLLLLIWIIIRLGSLL